MKPGFLSDKTIAIIGLGLMGGSLALSLRDKCARVVAHEKDEEMIALARKNAIVDQVSSLASEIIPQADIIILATPIRVILDTIARLPDWHSGSPFVMDLGSTKAEICHALDTLPARFHNVGGHPMCGKESSGLIQADARLFHGAVFALCSLPSTTMTDRKMAEAVVTACGAQPFWIGADEHDQLVAATSHAPYLVANALAASMPVDATPLVGPGLRSTTRIAASSPEMMTDIILTNQEAILTQLSHFQAQLSSLQQLIGSGTAQEIREGLAEGLNRYHQIIIPREPI